ncbi:hypothetical protein TL5118_04050 [Thalassovita autumnalis]|uniref:DUF3467 domain-containing protein n=1 Tax=Thalassovita autumnalis TaxID=2072972 RepID=A0A0P1FWW6_9RHOB|nr:hypothetical protein [Thalassovita autumnalis]CUH70075.1 hypothetical protein TL5118_04050 [Thalassovita autumnalis]CUH73499.1 hypothetical protein TL5120_03309 [Thalassovita autumnalis]
MPDTQPVKTEMKTVRSPEFRYIPCDAINLAISDNGVKLLMGVSEIDGTTTEIVGAHMSLSTAAQLSRALTTALSNYEDQSGNKITPPGELIRKDVELK